MRVPRGPDAEVPVHGGDRPAIAVPTTSGSTSRPRTRSRGKAAPAKYTSRAPRCAYDRIPKVARIIADLDKREQIKTQPLAEAARCRGLDRSYWNCTWNRAGAGSTRSSASQAQIPGGVRVLDRVPGRTMVRMAAQRRAAGARTERSRIGRRRVSAGGGQWGASRPVVCPAAGQNVRRAPREALQPGASMPEPWRR